MSVAPQEPNFVVFEATSESVCVPISSAAAKAALLESSSSRYEQRVVEAIGSLTTTKSTAAIYSDSKLWSTEEVGIFPSLEQSASLIHLDDYRTDPRFSSVDGSGFATVILDTGIDLDHPFFGPDSNGDGVADRIVYSYDFADNDSDASDVNGHGSNVSSIVASSDATYTGAAPGADIIHLKVFPDSGSGSFGMVESALQWVVANAATYNIASVNMSLGDSQNHASNQQLYGISDELAALAALDVIVVSSSGNSFYTFDSVQGVGYPAADANSLSVGAVYDGDVGSFSYSSGAVANSTGSGRITPFSQRDSQLTTIMAPGAPITGAGANGNLLTQHGTSQASPQISGIAVLAQDLAYDVLGRRLTVSEFVDLLRSTASQVMDGDDEDDNVTNTGLTFPLVDALALAEAILDLGGPSSPTLTITATDAILSEGDDGDLTNFTFTVQRTGDLTAESTVDFAVAGSGAAPANADDFGGEFPSGTLTFAPAEATYVLTIQVTGDTEVEQDEQFQIMLSNATSGTLIAEETASGTILADDSIVDIVPLDAEKPEGTGGSTEFQFTVSRTGDTSQALSVDYSVAGTGTFPADASDFGTVFPSGTVEIPAGSTSVTLVIPVVADLTLEDDEQFIVTLGTPTGATQQGIAAATGTIFNDDGRVSIAPDHAAANEGDSGTQELTFTVTRDGSTATEFQVNYVVVGVSEHPADGADFGGAMPSGTVTFLAGEVTKTITIFVSGDPILEPDEQFEVHLTAATAGFSIATDSATGTILNDDASLSWAASSLSQFEGSTGPTLLTFELLRSGNLDQIVTADYTIAGSGSNPVTADDFGDSQPGTEFPAGTVTFAVGEASKLISVSIFPDVVIEPDEEFSITLSNLTSGLGLLSGTAIGSILDDDAALEIVATIANAAEGNLHAFSIRRSGYLDTVQTVTWGVSEGNSNPANASDFAGIFPSGSVSFNPGQMSKLISFSSSIDSIAEPDEQFVVTLSSTSGDAQISGATASGTILNDDQIGKQFAPLDINQNGTVDASTDGNLILAVLSGLPESSLSPYLGSTILMAPEVFQNVEQVGLLLDVNEDGIVDAATDGNSIISVLFGLPETNLIAFKGTSSLSSAQIQENVLALTVVPQPNSSAAVIQSDVIPESEPTNGGNQASDYLLGLSTFIASRNEDIPAAPVELVDTKVVDDLFQDLGFTNSSKNIDPLILEMLTADGDRFCLTRLTDDEAELADGEVGRYFDW
ncbi:Intracellular serine protease [Bremerella volcania]|uniref:Intracellular serine protease n=1 Tax=Bremerella volcania TaxID=2527984 RepID=A0A518C8Z8_9BACT|nr:Calx-beta domain-containing protein [Bremerella volcania]QDU75664.1 Intracellular serine protease [Bremerella volcania]